MSKNYSIHFYLSNIVSTLTYPNITRGPLTTKAMAANMNLKNKKSTLHYHFQISWNGNLFNSG